MKRRFLDLRSLTWAVAACGLAGCASPSTGFYPLGIYGVGRTNDLPVVKAAGFNLVTGSATTSYLNTAQALGLKVLAAPVGSSEKGSATDLRRAAIQRHDSHPALWGWYLFDEPDMTQVPPSEVAKAHRTLKSLGARKPTVLVLFQGYEAFDYGNLADITMIDRYPVPWLPLANFGQHVRAARLALGPRKPLIAVIQAFDWKYFAELLPGETRFRPPTAQELRCMTYCALAEGATGLFYYAFESGGWKMEEHLDTWLALHAVVREVNERQPLFQGRRLWWPKQHRFTDRDKGFNAALESSVTSVLLRVGQGGGAVPAGDYIVAVNNTDLPQGYSFTLPRSARGAVPVFQEARQLEVREQRVSDAFEPYQVHVYGPL